jgi:hypothetical protein
MPCEPFDWLSFLVVDRSRMRGLICNATPLTLPPHPGGDIVYSMKKHCDPAGSENAHGPGDGTVVRVSRVLRGGRGLASMTAAIED